MRQVGFLPFCHKVECVRWVFTLLSQSGVRQVFFVLPICHKVECVRCQVGFYPSVTKWSASVFFFYPSATKWSASVFFSSPSATKWSASVFFFTLLPQSGVRQFFCFTLLSHPFTLDECAGQNWVCRFLLLQHPPP